MKIVKRMNVVVDYEQAISIYKKDDRLQKKFWNLSKNISWLVFIMIITKKYLKVI